MGRRMRERGSMLALVGAVEASRERRGILFGKDVDSDVRFGYSRCEARILAVREGEGGRGGLVVHGKGKRSLCGASVLSWSGAWSRKMMEWRRDGCPRV